MRIVVLFAGPLLTPAALSANPPAPNVVSNVRVRISVVHVIECIERIGSNFDPNPFANEWEFLSDTEVDVRETWTDQRIAAASTESPTPVAVTRALEPGASLIGISGRGAQGVSRCPLVSTKAVSAIGNGAAFKKGWEFFLP